MRGESIHRSIGRAGLAALLVVGSFVAAATVAAVQAGPAAALTSVQLVGVGPGDESPDGYSFLQDTSADGSVVFLSGSLSFTGGVGPNWYRVYLRSGSTTTAITPNIGYTVDHAGISDNGRFIAYTLAHGEPMAVFLYDTFDQTTTRVTTIGTDNYQYVQGSRVDVSNDGRFLLFDTSSSLDAADANGVTDVYRYDRQTSTLEWVSRNPDGTPSDGESVIPRMTPDGTSVVFSSTATNLIADDTNGRRDVFLWNDSSLSRVSTDGAGTQLTSDTGRQADIADDGVSVVFDSADALLNTTPWPEVFLKDTVSGAVELVSHEDGRPDGTGSRVPTISGDGLTVVFEGDWTRLSTGQFGNYSDVVAKDRVAGTMDLVSMPLSGTEANHQASQGMANLDGSLVAFDSFATNLVTNTPEYEYGGTVLNVYQAHRVVDRTPPNATIATPVDGATYDLGAVVAADYSCTDNVALAALDPCVGPVPNGDAIDTSVIGPNSFSVTATDAVGYTSTTNASYSVSNNLAAGLALTGSFTTIPAGYTVTVTDEGADGVTITVAGAGTAKVVMSICGGYIARIAPGSTVTLACGSVIARVAAGSVEVELSTSAGPVIMTVPAGGQATLKNDGNVVVAPESASATPITVTVAGATQPVVPGSTTGLRVVGFRQPIDTGSVWNTVKGGSTVPVKFQVFYGTTELTDPAVVKSMTVAPVACQEAATYDAIEELATTNTAGIRYSGGSFIANWKTPSLKNTCQRLTVTTTANTTLSAHFKLH